MTNLDKTVRSRLRQRQIAAIAGPFCTAVGAGLFGNLLAVGVSRSDWHITVVAGLGALTVMGAMWLRYWER